MDKRQQTILAGVTRLFGEGAGSFYSDAVSIAEDKTKHAASHLIGHCIREIQGIVFQVLGILPATVGAFDRGSDEFTSRPARIKEIARLLGIPETDSRMAWWLGIEPDVLAHRNGIDPPQPLDPSLMPSLDALLELLVERFEAVFKIGLGRVDDLLRQGPAANPAGIRKLLERLPLSANPVELAYFCRQAGPEWVSVLPSRLLDSPPPAFPVAGYPHPSWPVSALLARSAAAKPDDVHQAVMRVMKTGTDNNRVHLDLAEAERHLPGDKMASWSTLETAWLRRQTSIQSAYLWTPIELLVTALIEKGQDDTAFELARALFSLDCDLASQDDDLMRSFGASHYLASIGPIALALTAIKPIETLEWLTEIVAKHSSGPEDRTYPYAPSLTIKRNRRDRHDRSSLALALRDAADQVMNASPSRTTEVLEIIGSGLGDSSLGTRLRLYFLAKHLEALHAEAVEALSSELTFAPAFLAEAIALLLAVVESLEPQERVATLSAIDRGSLGRRLMDRLQSIVIAGGPTDEERAELDRIQDPFVSRDISHLAPISAQDLSDKSVSEFASYLATWRPENPWEAFIAGQNLMGLATAAVKNDPNKYAAEAAELLSLGPDYLSAVFNGWIQAVLNGTPFSWRGVLELADAVLAVPLEPSLADVRGRVAQVLSMGLESEKCAPEISLADRVWRLLVLLIEDASPSRAEEIDALKRGSSLESISLNWTRPIAVRAAIEYAIWLNPDPEPLPAAVRVALKRRLMLTRDGSFAVRMVVATDLHTLLERDPDWTISILPKLFPASASRKDEWAAAFDSYLGHYRGPGPAALAALRSEYERAAESLDTATESRTSLMSHHLVWACQWGIVEIVPPDPLVVAFYDKTPETRSHELLSWMGWTLWASRDGGVHAAIVERAKLFWEWRMASAPSEAEKSTFGWWCGSGLFEADWSLSETLAILRTGTRLVGSAHAAMGKVRELAPMHPVSAASVADEFVKRAPLDEDLSILVEDLFEIARIVQESDMPPEAQKLGGELESRLRARGYRV